MDLPAWPRDSASRLGLAMFALRAAIGTANDLIDEPLDASRKTGKPLPRGLISRRLGAGLCGAALVIGLALSAVSGPDVLAIAMLGTGIGLVYKLLAQDDCLVPAAARR